MNYYDILGVTETSEPEVIEAAYRALMKKYHPDRWTGEAERAENRAKLINEAYTALRSKPTRLRLAAPLSEKRPAAEVRGNRKRGRRRARDSAAVSEQPQGRGGSKARRAFVRILVRPVGVGRYRGSIIRHRSLGLGLGGRDRADPNIHHSDNCAPASRSASSRRSAAADFLHHEQDAQSDQYTVFWGDKQGRNYQIDAGSSIIHSSRFSGPPAVEFAQSDGPIQHVRDRG